MTARTDYVHNIYVVDIVSLPQVEGQLWEKQKENSISHCGNVARMILVCLLACIKPMEDVGEDSPSSRS